MKNKKGAEMTIGTIVIIILALIVLVAIIYGFTTGWGNLWNKITGFGGGGVNVQSVVDACVLACTTESAYDYCQLERNVVFGDDRDNSDMTCVDLEGAGVGLSACGITCP